MWERGLKFTIVSWTDGTDDVVPLVGTWIEIVLTCIVSVTDASFPLWERGLKSIAIPS